MKRIVSYILFVILLYLFLFNPPFSFFRERLAFGNLLILGSIVFAFFKPHVIKGYYFYFKREFTLLFILTVFVIFRTIMGGESSYVTQHIMGLCSLFLVIPMLLYIAGSIELRTETQVVRAFLYIGILASFISLLCLTDPELNAYIKTNLMRLTDRDYIMVNDYRGFGYSVLLTSDYGYILGLIAGYGSLFINEKKLLYICLPLILFAAIINARTGVILALFIIAFSFLSKKDIKYVFAIFFVGYVVIIYSSEFFELIGVESRTLEWSMSVFSEADAVSKGNVNESFAVDIMLKEMIVYPPSLAEWLVGRGSSIVRGGAEHSDVGWILQLNYGGIIYIILLYSFFLVILKKLYKRKSTQTCFWTVLAYLLIINTKSSVFPGYASFYLLFLFYALKILPKYVQENFTKKESRLRLK